jgi:2-dehydropantoate 2-reductase
MNSKRVPRHAVFGAGALGCYLAAVLERSGHPVGLVARGEHLAAIQENGILLQSGEGSWSVAPCRVSSDPAEIGPVDCVLLTVKAWQVPAAVASMGPLLGPTTRVLPLQNGIEAGDQVAAVVGPSRVLLGLCRVVCLLVAPGHVRHVALTPTIAMGEPSGAPLAGGAETVAAALKHAGVQIERPHDMRAALWQKLLLFAAMSGVGAITRSTVGEFRACPESRALLVDLMKEVQSLARACSIQLAQDVVPKTLAFIDEMAPGSTTSMQRDVASGKPSELEAILGVLARLGEQHGVSTPAVSFVYASLLPQELWARAAADSG